MLRRSRMTREEAIKTLYEYRHCFWDKLYEPICMAIKALEQEPSGDLISREAVEDALYEYSENNDVNYNLIITEYIDTIPPVNPQEPKTGKWIKYPHNSGIVVCNQCKGIRRDCRVGYTNYCNKCGARMVEAKGEE
jgi:hypothetical protein